MKSLTTLINDSSKWRKLKHIQKMRFIKSMYVWLLIVPFTSKLFSKIEDTISFTLHDKIYTFDLILPFSWTIFFLSALLLSIGNILFYFFCPRLIYEFNDYGEFTRSGRGPEELSDYVNEKHRNIRKVYEERAGVYTSQEVKGSKGNIIRPSSNVDGTPEVFHKLIPLYDSHNKPARVLTFLFYSFGCTLLLYVMFENFIWVFTRF